MNGARIAAGSLASLLLFGALAMPSGAASLPGWAERAAAQATPAWAAGYHAVTLLDSGLTTVGASGRVSMAVCGVRRVLDVQGADPILFIAPYERGTSTVRALHGWIRDHRGRMTVLGEASVTDAALRSEGTLYADLRHQLLRAPGLEPGDVVAWECVIDDDPLLAVWQWEFRDDFAPVLRSSFSLSLPAGCEPLAHWRGADTVATVRNGKVWTWDMNSLRPAARELMLPSGFPHKPRLTVTLAAQGQAPSASAGRSFDTWDGVAAWLSGLSDGSAALTPALNARAIDLTAGAKTPWDGMAALARYVQSLNYIAIDLGTGKGGGYTPHAAAIVLANGYGDCKDKANLFRTLARAAGFEAYMVNTYSGDPLHVVSEPPTPAQFNHKIVAIRLPDGTDATMAVDSKTHGRLLVFDPTDAVTPLGDLPADEQGSLVLLEASGGGELLKLPTADPAHRASLLRFEGTLQADGRLSGRLRGDMTGQDAVAWEWLRRLNPGEEFRARLLDWLASGGTRATVDSTTYAFDAAQARGTLSALLDWPTAGKVTSGRLLVFRPCAAHAYEIRELPDSARRSPVLVPCVSEVDTFSVRLPAGYAPEDLPAPVALDAGFGSLETRWWMDAGVLRVRFALASRRTLLPPARYADVRGFFAQANRARATPVVLAMN